MDQHEVAAKERHEEGENDGEEEAGQSSLLSHLIMN
jgi:hypothetical protein